MEVWDTFVGKSLCWSIGADSRTINRLLFARGGRSNRRIENPWHTTKVCEGGRHERNPATSQSSVALFLCHACDLLKASHESSSAGHAGRRHPRCSPLVCQQDERVSSLPMGPALQLRLLLLLLLLVELFHAGCPAGLHLKRTGQREDTSCSYPDRGLRRQSIFRGCEGLAFPCPKITPLHLPTGISHVDDAMHRNIET